VQAAGRAVEHGVAVVEDAAVGGHQPVAPAVGRGRHPDDGLVEVQAAGRAVERGVAVVEDAAVGRHQPVAPSASDPTGSSTTERGMLVADDREVALRSRWQSGCYDRSWRWHFLDTQDHACSGDFAACRSDRPPCSEQKCRLERGCCVLQGVEGLAEVGHHCPSQSQRAARSSSS
jgi:hypothetical protein